MTNFTVPLQAFVIFCGRADLWYLRFLKRGFRHCFVLLNDGVHWIVIDPLVSFMEVVVGPVTPHHDLPDLFRAEGFTVIEAPINRAPQRVFPFGLFTCVEAVKRILGLQSKRVLTPWQLY